MSKPGPAMIAVLVRILANACGKWKNTLLTRLKARERNWVCLGTSSETPEQITRLPSSEPAQKAQPPVTYDLESQVARRDGHARGQTIHYRMSMSMKKPIGISIRLKSTETVDDSVRFYGRMLSEALDRIGIYFNLDGLERPRAIILADEEISPYILASYSTELNVLFLRERVFDEQSLRVAIESVKAKDGISSPLFALENQPLATFVHEFAHWLHAAQVRSLSGFGSGDSLGGKMRFTAQEVIEESKSKYPEFDFSKISECAGKSWANDPEEVIAEAVTRYLLGDINNEVRIIMEDAGYERFFPRGG